ncbi:MAG TPA: nitrite reductase large subunit NirB [Solirubrobacterales bacterium]|nr:nitrite reductase large subunit NirB [Solirubrobacterales bacterium]
MSSHGITIVGGGIAAQALCEEVRERDASVPLKMICGEPCLPYDRVRLSEILVSGEEPEALTLRPAEWYEDNAVRLLAGRRVEGIDAGFGRLTLDGGETLAYHRVVLATGSRPLMPPLPGIELPGVIPFRDPAHCEAIRVAAAAGARIAVIGGGLLGLEAAYGVASQGARVSVVHLMDRLMERQLDDGAAELLRPAMEELGVEVLLGRQTERILGGERAEGLRLAGGEELPADLVVVSIGIRAEASLAAAAGIEVDRGIVVDDAMRTSAPGVWAVGECAEHRGTVYGLVAPIREQAAVAARSLLGEEVAYEGSLQWAKLKVMGVDVVSIGVPEGAREAVVADAEAPSYRKLVLAEGRAVGAILLGDTRGSEDLLAAIAAGEEVADPLERLAASAEASAADLPDAAQICNCNGVCKGAIVGAVEDGCATAREVMATTRAGTGCGSCKSTVIELVAALNGGAAEEPAYLCPCRRQTREDLAAVIRERGLEAVSEVAAACGTGRECGQCKPALAYLVSEINANRHREERAARFINDRVHANIQNDGTFSVVPRMYGGVTTPEELRRIADAAERYQVRMVKVTGGQRIDLLGVRKEDLPAIWEDIGMPSGHAYAKAVRTVKTCVGREFCRFGLGASIDLGVRLEKEWEGLHTPAKVKSGVSGCPRNCAEATIKDIGIVAIEGGWQIRVGGAAGSCVREGDLLATVDSADEVVRTATVVLQYYRENAEYKERLYDFVPRVGLEAIRRVVQDPDESAALLERFRIAKAAVSDPWLEREARYHPRQFSDLDGAAAPAETPIDALLGPPPEAVR